MPDIAFQYAKYETIKRIINQQVIDLVTLTEQNISEHKIVTSEEIRRRDKLTAMFSPEMKRKNALLKSFLYEKVYQHPKVARRNKKAHQILSGLFEKYLSNPELLPVTVQEKENSGDPYRVICDYIASMTDRFAQVEYNRLFKSKE
jgi:dGTPase